MNNSFPDIYNYVLFLRHFLLWIFTFSGSCYTVRYSNAFRRLFYMVYWQTLSQHDHWSLNFTQAKCHISGAFISIVGPP